MKVASVVILYNPTKSEVQNINTYNKFIDKILIFDNSENSNNEELLQNIDTKNFNYIKNESNEGLCIPLNKAIKYCIENEYDFLLTMDQDSYFLEENIKQYFEEIKNFNRLDLVGQFGLTHKNYELQKSKQSISKIEPYLITSASVININAIKKHDILFDENLFIDCVDFSFSFDISSKGLQNILFSENYFVHKIGEPVKRASFKTLFLVKKEKFVHSPLRIYYIKRNCLYLEKKYLSTEMRDNCKMIIKMTNSYIKRCLNYSKNPFEIYSYIRKAKKDFKNNQMGKIKK